jgi:hypothetical protein
MGRLLRVSSVALTALVIAGCENMIITGNPVTPYVGTWDAVRFEYVSQADPSLRRDLVSEGWRFTTAIDVAGRYTSTLTDPEGLVTTQTGTLAVTGASLVFTPSGAPGVPAEIFESQIVSPGLVLTNPQAQFSFGGDSQTFPSIQMIELRPR